MNKSIILLAAFAIICNTAIYAQESPKIVKRDFLTSNDETSKKIWKEVKKGNRNYRHHKTGHYKVASEYYNDAIEYNGENAALLYKAGVSNLMCSKNKQALKLLTDASDYNSLIAKDINYYLALALQRNNKFKEAKSTYEEYADMLGLDIDEATKQKIEARIHECENGINLAKAQKYAYKKTIEGEINSEFPEYAPIFRNIDSTLYFTSRRYNNKGNRRRSSTNYQYYEDIYYSKASNGKWDEPIYEKSLNKSKNDATIAANLSGNGMIIYRSKSKKGNLYLTAYNNKKNKWKGSKRLFINKASCKETFISFNSDSTKVVFSSDHKTSNGGMDIWLIERKPNGRWSKFATNMGAPFNTKYNEICPYFGLNDTILYFSSDGEKSIGGYDVMMSTFHDGQWSEPINMGLGINSGDDEMFFQLVPGSTRDAYLASKAPEGKGDYDIYRAMVVSNPKPVLPALPQIVACSYWKEPLLALEQPEAIKTMRLSVIKGIVSDFEGTKRLPAKIEVFDNETNQLIQTVNTDANGAYTVMLPSGKNYGMSVQSEGYFFQSENFNIPKASGYKEIEKNFNLLSMDPGSKVVLNNVFFDTGKSNLRPESYGELNRLAEVFKLYEKLVVEISGHTDNVGSKAANKKLSLARAQAVVDYLVSIGVPPARLQAKGYGPDQPRDTNKTAEGRQNNRRVEAKIISK